MQYSANQAAEATGKNVATITRAIKAGKISAIKDESGAWKIDGAELSRVFPLRAQSLQTSGMQKNATPPEDPNRSDEKDFREELATLRERVKAKDVLLEERANQIADLQKRLDKAEDRLAIAAPPSSLAKRRNWWPF